jgi:hypothetical protein
MHFLHYILASHYTYRISFSLSVNFYKVIINVVVDLDTEECVQKKSIMNIKFVSFIRLICSYKSHSIIMEMTEKIYWKTGTYIVWGCLLQPTFFHPYSWSYLSSFYFTISFNYLWVQYPSIAEVHRRHWIYDFLCIQFNSRNFFYTQI